MKAGPLLPAGQPHVAVVLLWYPLFTQPFIFREIESLSNIMPLEVYTLYGKNLRHCSQEMRRASDRPNVFGSRAVFSVLWEIAKQSARSPRKIWKLLKRSVFRKWRDLETFGENLWGFCVGVSLGRRFREDGIDIVYSPWPRGAATAAWVGACIADLPFGLAARGDNLAPADPDLGDKFSAASFIRANNAADRKRIEEFDAGQAKGKTGLVYNSLTLAPGRPATRFASPQLRLLALGRFDVTKGFDTLLEACALLKKKNVNFRLTLAGGGGKLMGLGNMDHVLRKLRRDLDLENEVAMPGLLSHDALPELLANHDIFVAPCVIDPSGRRDGIPNTVIEAAASGMPVIATNINALPEIIRNDETGVAVPQKNPQALAEAIIALASDPQKAERLGANGAALAASIFDPQANAVRFADMLGRARADWRKRKCAA